MRRVAIFQYGYISPKSTVEPWMLAGIGATGNTGHRLPLSYGILSCTFQLHS